MSTRARHPAGRVTVRRRRRTLLAAALVAVLVVVGFAVAPSFDHAVREITLPLHHEDIIRQQAHAKHLDPALVAGVIYVESRFRPRTSPAGAEGLMQLEPSTAQFLAKRTGGTTFHVADLDTPQVNIAYGCYYLRYLLDQFGHNRVLALAAYNGGEANVGHWLRIAHAKGHRFSTADIPYPETRAYVGDVLSARDKYASAYPSELGLR